MYELRILRMKCQFIIFVRMNKALQNIRTFLLLFLFLFPFAEKEMHAWEHRNDEHCDSPNEKHFHEMEHNCDICDLSAPETLASNTDDPAIIAYVAIPFSFSFSADFFSSDPLLQLSPRAPPFIS